MSKIKFKTILELSSKIKKSVEENHKLPASVSVGSTKYNYPTCAYLIANAVINPEKDVELLQMSNAPSPTGETVKLTFNSNEYKSLAKNLVTFMKPKNVRRLPNYLNGKNKKIKQRVFIYSLAKILVFYKNNKRLPNTCNFYTSETVSNSTTSSAVSSKNNCSNPYTSTPHYTTEGVGLLGQKTSYYCGPNMIHQMLKKFGVTKYSQDDIAKLAGTTTSGTAPEGLLTVIEYINRKEKLNLKVERKYLSDFGNTLDEQFKAIGKLICQSKIFVGTHIGYEDSGSQRGSTVFGHYECFDKVDTSKKQLRILNSLGVKSGNGYLGHLQWRSYVLEKAYINNKTGVKSIWLITKQ